jgi:hypothetical protein
MASEAARWVLRIDLFTAALTLVVGLSIGGREAVLALPAVAVAFGVLMAVGLGVAEHGLVPGVYPEVTALVAFVALGGVAAGAVFLLPVPTRTVVAAIVVGAGVGLVGYRLVFGFVRPVPASRLQ